jgi:hypothetical protein
MKKHFTLSLLAIILLSSIYAQRIEGVAGFLKAGYMHAPSSGKIFSQVAPAGITGFDDNFYAFGGEAYYRKLKNIYTIEGTIGMQKQYSSGTNYAEPYNGAAHGKWGRIIAENDHYWLYPSVGAGASFIQLTTYDKISGNEENSQEKTLVSPSFDAGMNADFLLSKINYKEGYYYGWILGIRAGYRASVSSNNWKDEQVVKPYDKPSYANSAFYVTITIGGGSFNREN